MKVLFIEPCFQDFGGYHRAIGLAKALSKRGIKVDLLVPSQKSYSFLINKETIQEGLVRYELPRWEINFFINGRLARGIISCLFVVLKRYDIVHAFASVQLETVIPFLLARVLKKNVFLDWDDYWQDSPIFYQSNLWVKKYLLFLENNLPRKADHMTVTSNFLKTKAKKLGASEVLKIINGVDKDQFVPMSKFKARKLLNISRKEKMILSFGNTYSGKRAFLLFKTFEKILARDSEVFLYFNQDPKVFWQDKVVNKGISKSVLKNIINTGYIDLKTADGRAYLGAADCILFLMGSSSSEKACFPVRIGTYLNAGKVIATNRSKTEVDSALLKYNCAIIGKNLDELSLEVVRLLNNKKKQNEIRRNVLQARKKMAWDNLILSLIKYYEKVIRE